MDPSDDAATVAQQIAFTKKAIIDMDLDATRRQTLKRLRAVFREKSDTLIDLLKNAKERTVTTSDGTKVAVVIQRRKRTRTAENLLAALENYNSQLAGSS